MIKYLIIFFYSIISAYGLYRIKLSSLQLNTDLFVGSLCYGSGFIIWLVILKLLPLSVAFPAASSGLLIFTMLFGLFFLKESITLIQSAGILLIIVGIIFVFYNNG